MGYSVYNGRLFRISDNVFDGHPRVTIWLNRKYSLIWPFNCTCVHPFCLCNSLRANFLAKEILKAFWTWIHKQIWRNFRKIGFKTRYQCAFRTGILHLSETDFCQYNLIFCRIELSITRNTLLVDCWPNQFNSGLSGV